jgi:hypothetical protein
MESLSFLISKNSTWDQWSNGMFPLSWGSSRFPAFTCFFLILKSSFPEVDFFKNKMALYPYALKPSKETI